MNLNHPDAIAGVDLTHGQVRETKTVTAETKTADDSKRSPPRLTGPRFSYRVIHGKHWMPGRMRKAVKKIVEQKNSQACPERSLLIFLPPIFLPIIPHANSLYDSLVRFNFYMNF